MPLYLMLTSVRVMLFLEGLSHDDLLLHRAGPYTALVIEGADMRAVSGEKIMVLTRSAWQAVEVALRLPKLRVRGRLGLRALQIASARWGPFAGLRLVDGALYEEASNTLLARYDAPRRGWSFYSPAGCFLRAFELRDLTVAPSSSRQAGRLL